MFQTTKRKKRAVLVYYLTFNSYYYCSRAVHFNRISFHELSMFCKWLTSINKWPRSQIRTALNLKASAESSMCFKTIFDRKILANFKENGSKMVSLWPYPGSPNYGPLVSSAKNNVRCKISHLFLVQSRPRTQVKVMECFIDLRSYVEEP